MLKRVLIATALLMAVSGVGSVAQAETRSLKLYHTHTRESATIVYKRDGRFDQAGLAKLNRFLRDWRNSKSIKMDPKLFDILWEVYRKSGATRPINIVSSYRSPQTNEMLRRRSSGVAQNSAHTRGQAMDFFIPGVPLAKLRALGLQAQAGGVGYYPSSGSPFVHMDTGSVRHWPRMSRSQLLAVFPKGGTLHVPSDGKQLPGYSEALAAYKSRQARGVLVSWATGGTKGPSSVTNDTVVVAEVEEDEETVTTTVVAAADVPTPRIAPERDDEDDVAGGQSDAVAVAIAIAGEEPGLRTTGEPMLAYPAQVDRVLAPDRLASLESLIAAEIDFDEAIIAPAVPADLADAMAARDTSQRDAMAVVALASDPPALAPAPVVAAPAPVVAAAPATSVPIQPTAIVETVDIGVDLSRTLRADAVTAAVFRETRVASPAVMAYAAALPGLDDDDKPSGAGVADVPRPQPNPLRSTVSALAAPVVPGVETDAMAADRVYARLPEASLTLTKLDTQGLRTWIGEQSTSAKRYAVFTMPAFAENPALLDKPEVTFDARFDQVVYRGMGTDQFAGSSTQPPAVVDLTTSEIVSAR